MKKVANVFIWQMTKGGLYMKTINSELRKEMCKLEKIVKRSRERIQMAPKGYLRISKKRNGVEYYYKSAKTKGSNGRYIKKQEYELVQKLAQRDYDMLIIKASEERIKSIKNFLATYEKTDLGKIYEKTNPYRRKLICETELSDEEYVKRWQDVKYDGKPFLNETQEIITEKGERVRSKSEKIIADKLYALGIPYRYEYPLELGEKIKIYPDFTILRMPAREEVYLEHFGMMDDMDYVGNVLYKLNTYEKNEIYLGVNLFFTYETNKKTLNTRALDGIIKELFCVK